MAPPREKYAPKRSSAEAVQRENLGQTTYPGKLLENYQGEAENKDGSIRQVWFQRIQRQDQAWEDGNLVERINQPILQWPDGGFAGKGSEADKLAQAFEDCLGCDMMPGNPESAKYAGHYFLFRDEKIEDTKFYQRVPVEYLGAEYTYPSAIRTIVAKGDGEGSGGNAAVPAEDENLEEAELLAALISGQSEEDIRTGVCRDLVRDSASLADVQSILGVSKVGGMTKTANGALMDRLIDRNLGEIVDGQFVAKEAVAA